MLWVGLSKGGGLGGGRASHTARCIKTPPQPLTMDIGMPFAVMPSSKAAGCVSSELCCTPCHPHQPHVTGVCRRVSPCTHLQKLQPLRQVVGADGFCCHALVHVAVLLKQVPGGAGGGGGREGGGRGTAAGGGVEGRRGR